MNSFSQIQTLIFLLKKEKHRRKEREKKHIRKFFQELEGEHQTLLQQWREEFKKEQRQSNEASGYFDVLGEKVWKFLSYAEVFISNMPLTIGAVGLSWVTQGTIWFKFMEENIDTCTTVHFYSPHCIYSEFPGCFDCDMSNPIYLIAVTFHYFCHCVAAICCLLFLTKCLIAWRVVADELSNPTTSTPCGVVCITLICVAAGRGIIGEVVVLVTSAFHFMLSIWFLYMAIFKYHLWPDPGWFPNTVGIAYAAVKTWLYFPVPGLIFMVVRLLFAALNTKTACDLPTIFSDFTAVLHGIPV